jgi:glycosyltransferase involved in cell wall biosynthesis
VGIPTNEIESMARSSSSSGRQFKLLSIGRLLHWKGFHLALAAFARLRQLLPEAEYTVIGEGPERSRLVTLTEQFNLGSSARMLGSLSREKTLAELSHTDVLVHPSLHDSGGWVCVEAMSSGKPVICLDLGGPSLEVCAETGFKVPARDPEQAIQDMADAMLRLALDRELRISMGEAGRAHAKEQFALENKGPEMARFYAEVLDRSKPSD